MDHGSLLLEYLKEQYAQARQHETRQTAATTFLTASAGVVLGFLAKDKLPDAAHIWIGTTIFVLGLANLQVISAYHKGNRFHVTVAGKVRNALERTASNRLDIRPISAMRDEALEIVKLSNGHYSVGSHTHRNLRYIPFGTMLVGAGVALGRLPLDWLLALLHR